MISLLVVLLSILIFVLETLPYFGALTAKALDNHMNITNEMLRKELHIFTDITPYKILLLMDNACNFFFLIEFMVKLVCSPSKRKFLLYPITISEMFCFIPYYMAVAVVMLHPDPLSKFLLIRIMFAMKVLRIFRIFILMKHFLALKILIYTIKASTKELSLLLVVVMIGMVIFACLEYYMEVFSTSDSQFEHIPMAFWWALITMTTVGYGDIVPSTGAGYVVGSICAISGVLVIALSVPAVVNNFTLYYTHARSRQKLAEKKKVFNKKKWDSIFGGVTKGNKLKFDFKNIVNGAMKNKSNVPALQSILKPKNDAQTNLTESLEDTLIENNNETTQSESKQEQTKGSKQLKHLISPKRVAPIERQESLLNPHDSGYFDRLSVSSPCGSRSNCSAVTNDSAINRSRRNSDSNVSAVSFNDTENLIMSDDDVSLSPEESNVIVKLEVPRGPTHKLSTSKSVSIVKTWTELNTGGGEDSLSESKEVEEQLTLKAPRGIIVEETNESTS